MEPVPHTKRFAVCCTIYELVDAPLSSKSKITWGVGVQHILWFFQTPSLQSA